MTEDKWLEIKEMVKKNFGVLENQVFELSGDEGEGTEEELIFSGPMGKIKLTMIVKPLVIDKKTHYSKRMGTAAKVDYVTSDTEKVRTFKAYLWETTEDAWKQIDSSQFGRD